MISTSRTSHLLHMDHFGLSRTISIGENYYALVIVSDYSRFTWTLFLAQQNEAFHAFKMIVEVVQNEKNVSVTSSISCRAKLPQ